MQNTRQCSQECGGQNKTNGQDIHDVSTQMSTQKNCKIGSASFDNVMNGPTFKFAVPENGADETIGGNIHLKDKNSVKVDVHNSDCSSLHI